MFTPTMRYRTPLFVALGLWLTCAGLAAAQVPAVVTPEVIAEQLEARIREKFTATNLQIQVIPFDDPSYTQQGRLQWVSISAEELVQDVFTIQQIFTKVLDTTLDLDQLFAAKSVVARKVPGRSIVTAYVSEADLNRMIGPESSLSKNSGIEDLRMEVLPGQLRITGKYHPFFDADLELIGRLEVAEHYFVNFMPVSAKFNGVPLPQGLLRGLLKKMNPILDFHDVPLGPSVEQVIVDDHRVLVTG
jgi:hypothetical protein